MPVAAIRFGQLVPSALSGRAAKFVQASASENLVIWGLEDGLWIVCLQRLIWKLFNSAIQMPTNSIRPRHFARCDRPMAPNRGDYKRFWGGPFFFTEVLSEWGFQLKEATRIYMTGYKVNSKFCRSYEDSSNTVKCNLHRRRYLVLWGLYHIVRLFAVTVNSE